MVWTPFAGRSSNGKTADSGSAYRGSSPCLPANQVAMKTLALASILLLSACTAFGQNSSDLFDKAPAPVDEALRARIDKFYGAFIEGKFKDAYLLVADDSQDQFFALPKKQYKVCQIIRINYSE